MEGTDCQSLKEIRGGRVMFIFNQGHIGVPVIFLGGFVK